MTDVAVPHYVRAPVPVAAVTAIEVVRSDRVWRLPVVVVNGTRRSADWWIRDDLHPADHLVFPALRGLRSFVRLHVAVWNPTDPDDDSWRRSSPHRVCAQIRMDPDRCPACEHHAIPTLVVPAMREAVAHHVAELVCPACTHRWEGR